MNILKEEILEKAVKNFQLVEGYKIINVDSSVTCNEILEFMNHHKSIGIQKSVVNNQNQMEMEMDRFVNNTICFSCGEKGHVTRNCPMTKPDNCVYCGLPHSRDPCKLILCFNCNKIGHHAKVCREYTKNEVICDKCINKHDIRDCAILWRKYILKRAEKNEKFIMSCPHCLSTEHFIEDCQYGEKHNTVFTSNYLQYCISARRLNNLNKRRNVKKFNKKNS